jgi:hypothetical protein
MSVVLNLAVAVLSPELGTHLNIYIYIYIYSSSHIAPHYLKRYQISSPPTKYIYVY